MHVIARTAVSDVDVSTLLSLEQVYLRPTSTRTSGKDFQT